MNKYLLSGIFFVLGAAAGAVGGYLYAERKVRDEAAIDMNETREYYKQKLKEAQESKVTDEDINKAVMDKLCGDEHPMDDEEEVRSQLEAAKLSEKYSGDIYVITENEFEAAEEDVNVETLWLYTDTVLAERKVYSDPDTESVVSIPDTIGYNLADQLIKGEIEVKFDSDGDRVVYIANEKTHSYYEVYLMNYAFNA